MPSVVNLLIDIGNSSVKASFARGVNLEEAVRYGGTDVLDFIVQLVKKKKVCVIAISSVRKFESDYFQILEKMCDKLLVINSGTELPIVNLYASPESLGTDRIISAIAAAELFPGKNAIIFDFGTALTVDFVSEKGEFLGGNISLGLTSRFKALNEYTKMLPLVENPAHVVKVGSSTVEAIEAGVILGLIFEIEGYIKEYSGYIYIFTGGDAIYFAEKLKSSIFVVYNLVLMGLARVAENYAKP